MPGTFLNMNLILTRRMTAFAVLLASILLTACGLRSTNSSSETLTVYEDAPTLTHLDLGPPGNSPGDVYHFFAPLHSSPGGPVTGEVFGSKTLFQVATDANPNFEKRATLLFFTFGNAQDQIIALGVHDYSPTAAELMRASLSCARYWAGPVNTWARVANWPVRGMLMVRIRKCLRC
jgi:hypothetical protein